MSYIDNIFARANIQQIREFLLNGVGMNTVDSRPYIERLDSAHDNLLVRLQRDYPNHRALSEVTDLVYRYAGIAEEVGMEVGLQVGAILAVQVFQNLTSALGQDK